MPDWKFLTNHALVLSHLAKSSRITAHEVSLSVGITERTVRRIIAELEATGYIRKSKEGRRNMYTINPNLPLRHLTQRETAIGDFLKVLGWKQN